MTAAAIGHDAASREDASRPRDAGRRWFMRRFMRRFVRHFIRRFMRQFTRGSCDRNAEPA
ncbi:hypothetical protein AQ797_14130 [Burkholderia pseudomallei]|nr:hypothetical protein AM256_06125 [Burkholderia pseudomallei]EEC36865.1 conserved hypothetical protein [Burkholderia pseudomallei 576]ALB99297.1 hypothetical protein AM257_06130 [Burkholderia pseudomallei]APD35852.1 hypothetical protein BK015_12390 [Burkholderia pseudomallei]ARK40679.1 hypothetical protein BOC60_10865 [Burkholderia pseudomallei]